MSSSNLMDLVKFHVIESDFTPLEHRFMWRKSPQFHGDLSNIAIVQGDIRWKHLLRERIKALCNHSKPYAAFVDCDDVLDVVDWEPIKSLLTSGLYGGVACNSKIVYPDHSTLMYNYKPYTIITPDAWKDTAVPIHQLVVFDVKCLRHAVIRYRLLERPWTTPKSVEQLLYYVTSTIKPLIYYPDAAYSWIQHEHSASKTDVYAGWHNRDFRIQLLESIKKSPYL